MRWLAETVVPYLNKDRQLLIVPSIALAGRYGLQNLPYTDVNRIMYLTQVDRPENDASFEEILRQQRIGYVFVTKLVSHRLAKSKIIRYDTIENNRIVGKFLNIIPGHCFGMAWGEYDNKHELRAINKVLDKLGAKVMARSNSYGEIYALPDFPVITTLETALSSGGFH